jgi:hypothetical protein
VTATRGRYPRTTARRRTAMAEGTVTRTAAHRPATVAVTVTASAARAWATATRMEVIVCHQEMAVETVTATRDRYPRTTARRRTAMAEGTVTRTAAHHPATVAVTVTPQATVVTALCHRNQSQSQRHLRTTVRRVCHRSRSLLLLTQCRLNLRETQCLIVEAMGVMLAPGRRIVKEHPGKKRFVEHATHEVQRRRREARCWSGVV